MDKSIFSKEWIDNFKIVFGEEAESILDNIDNDLVFLSDILYDKIGHIGKLLTSESVAKQMAEKKYEAVAEAYYKSLLAPKLLEEVIRLSLSPNRGV